jgi:hypothetical protein
MSAKLFYTPTASDVESSVVDVFRRYVNTHFALSLQDVWQLHAFSVDRPNDFYNAIARFTNLIIEYDPVKPVRRLEVMRIRNSCRLASYSTTLGQ